MNSLEGEVWVPARSFTTDYAGLYIISNLGRCYNLNRKKFVGSCYNGYFYVGLCNKGKQENIQVGRLMLISFGIPIPEHLKDLPLNKIQASHIDEDKTHNYLWNLCWENNQENSSRQLRRQRCSKAHNHYKKPILQYTKSGEFVREWDCAADVYRELGIHKANITACCKGRLNQTGGYAWKYKI